jgi:hypothetical protein
MQSFDVFKVGDEVYVYRVEHERVPVPCPDCSDTRKWKVTTPAGDSWEITCPRCNGAKYDFQQPHCIEAKLKVEAVTISEISIRQRKRYQGEEIDTWVEYTFKGGTYRKADRVFATHEEADAAGQVEMAKDLTADEKRWKEERERVAKYAGETLLDVVRAQARQEKKGLEDKLDALKEGFLEAIRNPDFDGPELRKGVFGSSEITSAAMAEWLNGIFSEAELDGWTKEEIHEATCHC